MMGAQVRRSRAAWFETPGYAGLLTMRVEGGAARDGKSSHAQAARNLLLPVELGTAAGQFFRAHGLDVVVVELPLAVGVPVQRRLHGCLRTDRRFQQAQRQL